MSIMVKSKLFDNSQRDRLILLSDLTNYVESITTYEFRKFSGFHIQWFLHEGDLVGYALIGKVQKTFFQGDEEAEEMFEIMEPLKDYYYIPYFEIFCPYQNKGFGKQCFESMRDSFFEAPFIVYTTEDSIGFWEKMNFKIANYSDYWLMHEESIPSQIAV